MATSGRIENGLSESDITYLDIKELNQILKEKQVPKLEQQYIKQQRRRNRMKTYRRDNRQRKAEEHESQILTHARLLAELALLKQEVSQLWCERFTLMRQIMDPSEGSDEDDLVVD